MIFFKVAMTAIMLGFVFQLIRARKNRPLFETIFTIAMLSGAIAAVWFVMK